MPSSLTTEEIKYLKELVAAGERGRTIAAQRMTSFFECVEMTRSLAAVSKNDAGSNSASRAALRSVRRLAGLDLGASNTRLPSVQAGARLSLSHRRLA